MRSARATGRGKDVVTRDHAIHETEFVGPIGVDGIGRQGHLVSHGEGDSFGQSNKPARPRHQTPRRFGNTEFGVIGRDHHVATDHHLESARESGAVGGGD